MQKAYQLLESRKYKTIAEVRYEVGIESASNFAKVFHERFGTRPNEFKQELDA